MEREFGLFGFFIGFIFYFFFADGAVRRFPGAGLRFIFFLLLINIFLDRGLSIRFPLRFTERGGEKKPNTKPQ